MKKLILLLFLGATAFISAQNINGRFSSSLYTFERYDSLNSSEQYLRAFEMLNLNLNYKNISVRSYLNFDWALDLLTEKQKRNIRIKFFITSGDFI